MIFSSITYIYVILYLFILVYLSTIVLFMQWHGRNVDSLCSLQEWTSRSGLCNVQIGKASYKIVNLDIS